MEGKRSVQKLGMLQLSVGNATNLRLAPKWAALGYSHCTG
jgi:hypothetical protein